MDLSTLATNLRRLRTVTGKSQAELAQAAGISRVGYRNIETGAVVPRVDSLMRIAAALGVRLDDLLAPAQPLTAVRFRAQKKMVSRQDVLVDVARWLADYGELERLLGETLPFGFAKIPAKIASLPRGEPRAKAAAAMARAAVGLNREDVIRDVCGLLEDNGVKVITAAVASPGFFGLSVDARDGGPAVVVNVWDRISVERWIFTAAHELAHLLLHLTAFDVSRTEEDKVEEREADAFASYFLMPEELFDQEWQEARGLPLVERVLKVKRIFRVSYRTVLYRITSRSRDPREVWIRFQVEYRNRTGHTLGGADEPQRLKVDDFRTGVPAARGADEPERLGEWDFVKDRLSRLVRAAVEREIITLARAAEILRTDLETMSELADSWL